MNPPPLPPQGDLIVTTANEIHDHQITSQLGVVRGIVVRSMGFSRGITGSFKAIAGGNIPEFAAVCEEARAHSHALMLEHALALGANAVIAFRYDATPFTEGCTEVLAYGTAVKITPNP